MLLAKEGAVDGRNARKYQLRTVGEGNDRTLITIKCRRRCRGQHLVHRSAVQLDTVSGSQREASHRVDAVTRSRPIVAEELSPGSGRGDASKHPRKRAPHRRGPGVLL